MENDTGTDIDEIVNVSDDIFDEIVAEIEDIKKFDTEEIGPVKEVIKTRKKINIRVHGLMPKHEKEAIEMIRNGVSLAEVASRFGIARSDIVYVNI